jgi:phosphopantothenoylcysteine synthetase/decarboxylase
VVLVGAQGEPEALPLMSKRELADRILDRTLGLLQQQRGKE